MSYTYAIGDVHGMYNLMVKALDFIHDDKVDGDKTIVMLGDYVDRGPDSALCIHELRLIEKSDNVICLKGNHEDMMCNNTISDIGIWLMNGGKQTLESYDQLPNSDIEDDRKWMRSLPTVYVDKHRAFVHAAYFDDDTVNTWEDVDHMRMWYRYNKTEDEKVTLEDGTWRYVVHGHTPQRGYPFVGINRLNLDVGSCWDNTLAVAKFNDDVPGGAEHIEMIYG